MNTNPETIAFFAKLVGAIIGTFWFLCFMNGVTDTKVQPLKFPERFDIGYIDDPQQQAFAAATVEEVKIKKVKEVKKKEEKPINRHQDGLSNDCVDALVGLGVKRAEAQRVTKRTLANNLDITTPEQFILEVFKKDV